MNYVEQEVIFTTESHFGSNVPLAMSSLLLRHLESTARPSVRMLLEGTSASVGAPPVWLEKASDIRTLGFSDKHGLSVLHVKAPRLGDAAPKLFEQPSLWPTPAEPDETALQVMARVAVAVRQHELGSDLFDRRLLKRFGAWSPLFSHDLKSVDLPLPNSSPDLTPRIDLEVTVGARSLSDQTPSPRQVRIIGKLDMVRHSTRSFGLVLDSGEEVRGVLVEGSPDLLQGHLGQEITVIGKAIYRPSGTLLRLDASEILPTTEGRRAFSKVPSYFSAPAPRNTHARRPTTAKSGVAAFFGTWPGEETDCELLKALEEVRV